jgi:serine/threonine-protein kinase
MTDASDLTARLQRALGDRYRIERELGGGGMSRLFLANEPSLGREVVVKLLPPELASEVSAARFQREIELAARFQHPNIVPVLAGGASEGLLFYVMPFVRGESLRQLLQSGRPIPVATALAIVDEVGDALTYAHGEGVVHRDIKPENILLAAGHAMVTDFGVARALEAARSGDQLTGTGIAVGSPGYMAPEQLAGGMMDARTDQYALGTLAYELLSGAPPFIAPSVQGLVIAHMTETPRAVSERRPEVPAQVSAAISRALAKNPDDRFPDVPAFRSALRGDETRVATGGRTWGRRAVVPASVIALVLVAVVMNYANRGKAPLLDKNLIAVAPFTVLDPSLEIWREGLVDVLSRKLDGAGSLRAVPPSIAVRRFSGRADETSAEALGRATGAGLALIGTLYAEGTDSARLEATLYDVDAGRVRSDVVLVDVNSQMARLTDSVAVRLLRDLGQGVPLLSSLGTRSLPALKEFLQGEQYYRRSAWDSAAEHYERAATIDSSFVLPLYRVTLVYGWRGSLTDAAVLARAEQAARQARGLSRHDSLLVRAAALSSEQVGVAPTDLAVSGLRETRVLLEEAVRAYPQSQDAAMAYADDIFHFGSHTSFPGGAREIRALFDRVIEIDSSFTPAYLHPILLSLALSDTAAAFRYARAHLARDPRDEDAAAAFGLFHVLSSARPSETFAALLDTASLHLLRQLSQLTRSWPDPDESEVRLWVRYHELLQRSNPRGEVPPAQMRIRAQALAFRGHLSEAAKYMLAGLREPGVLGNAAAKPIAIELALLGVIPAADADTLFRRLAAEPIGIWSGYFGIPYFAMRRDTLALKRLVMRIDSLRRAAPEAGPLTSILGGGARAYLALARGDSVTALREFGTMADTLFRCGGCHVWRLTNAQLLARAGRWREAESILRVEPGYWATPVGVLWTLERARVKEQLGDLASARDNYAYVVAAWRNPDEQLKVYVEEARRALARLSPDVDRK